jgi:hypothetical protein
MRVEARAPRCRSGPDRPPRERRRREDARVGSVPAGAAELFFE